MNTYPALKKLMLERDMTRYRLSQISGTSQAQLSRYANGQNVSLEFIQRIAATFDMKVSEYIALAEDLYEDQHTDGRRQG